MSESQKTKVQSQFGVAAQDYATSDIHANGESLQLLVDWTQARSDWSVLDVATGAGHTALAFAPLVRKVVATDITQPMLAQACELAVAKKLTNIETKYAEAESLPFENESFELVTCRLASHHFDDAQASFLEMARVLKPNGILAFTDNITVEDSRSAEIYNRYERIRDPSHQHVGSLADLTSDIEAAGLTVENSRVLIKEFEFQKWADRQNVSEVNKQILLDIMKSIPPGLASLFQPRWADDTLYFSLWEAVVVARKLAGT
jgi:ubiquinone/menaquinone biosynthesis C-methylase UbiE